MFKISKNKSLFLNIRATRLKYVVLSLFFLHLLSAHSICQRYMICFGDDGHVAIEPTQDHLCCEFPASVQTDKTNLDRLTAPVNYDNCRDIPFTSICNHDNLLVRNTISSPQALSSSLVVSAADYLTSDNTLKNADCISAPHLNIPLLSYRSVSLLI